MKYIFFISLIALSFMLTSCPDEDPVKLDPCEGKMPVTAEFTIKQAVSDFTNDTIKWVETDSVVQVNSVVFEAVGNYESYEWQLGDDPKIKTGKKIFYRFEEPYGKLKMRLIVKNKPDTLCFPNDDGVDTVNKSFHVINFNQIAIIGDYLGYDTANPKETYIVKIRYEEERERGLIIYNVDKGGYYPADWDGPNMNYSISNYLVIFDADGNLNFDCKNPIGSAELQKDWKTVIIDYIAGELPIRTKHRFIGVRQ